MEKTAVLIVIIGVLFIVGCGVGVVAQLFGIGISIAGEFVCDELTDDPTLYELCTNAIGFFFNVDAGTIEIHNVNGQWTTLTSEPMSFNLIQSPGKQQVMTFKENIPLGKYDKIRIDLESVKIQTKNGTYTTIIPNKELIFDVNIEVSNNQKSVVELNLDIAKSLHRTEDNKVVFAPVMNVKSRKNVNVQVDQNKKLINVNGGTILDNRNVGMDLNGQMRKDYFLDRNLKLTQNNNKIVVAGSTVVKSQSPLKSSPTVQTSMPSPSVTTATNPTTATASSVPSIPKEGQTVGQTNNAVKTNVKEFTITAKKWLFNPNTITVNKGETIKLNIIPSGVFFDFALPEFGVAKKIYGTTMIGFTAEKAGTFEFRCSSCEDWRGMKGNIVVKDVSTTINQAIDTERELVKQWMKMYGQYDSAIDEDDLDEVMALFKSQGLHPHKIYQGSLIFYGGDSNYLYVPDYDNDVKTLPKIDEVQLDTLVGKYNGNNIVLSDGNMAIRFINLGDIQGFLDVFWQSKQENQSCTDSDNGKNKYMKGEIVVWNPDGSKKLSKVEKCQNGDYLLKTGSHINANPNAVYVEEYFCEETLYDSTYLYSSTYYECPNGCNDGACIK